MKREAEKVPDMFAPRPVTDAQRAEVIAIAETLKDAALRAVFGAKPIPDNQ